MLSLTGLIALVSEVRAQTIKHKETLAKPENKRALPGPLCCRDVLFAYVLRRAAPARAISPEPNNHTAAGTGTTAVVPTSEGTALAALISI